jgi:hypothetical protein
MYRKMTFGLVAALGLTLSNAKPADAQIVINVPGVRISGFGPAPSFGTVRHYHVQYRSPYWQERSFQDGFEAREFARYKESQGYEVDLRRHGFHIDVRFRMAHWQSYRTVNSHAAAHELERMLEYRGFQARIIHH